MNYSHNKHAPSRGFSLIELMIAVAVVAILSMVAYPQYTSHAMRAKRAAAQQSMLDISAALEMYRIDLRQYPTALGNGLTEMEYSLATEVASNYVVSYSVNNAATPPFYTITATPLAGISQAADGPLTLNSTGLKTPPDKW